VGVGFSKGGEGIIQGVEASRTLQLCFTHLQACLPSVKGLPSLE
jgi:hypothetical protein